MNDTNKTLVTGASGFLGRELVGRLVSRGEKVIAFSRNEGKLIDLKQFYPSIDIISGSVSDPFEVAQAFKNVSKVYHLAASKHVSLSEKYTRECVKTNIVGTLNILENTLNLTQGFTIGISTDKAAQVSGVYGASKLLMERLFNQYSQINKDHKYRIVRYGNVLYSTGSVLCKWRENISNGQPITVTDTSATRFFWSVAQALDLIDDCLERAVDSSPYLPDMRSMQLSDLIRALEIKYNNGNSVEKNIIGLQPGENLHEKILEEGPYSNEVALYTVDEIIEVI